MKMIKILLIDNHDSFTYNLAAMFTKYNNVKLTVQFPEDTKIEKISEYDKIIFSPGPGIATDTNNMDEILSEYHKSKSFLGICLGHQAIALHFNASISNLGSVNHGKRNKLIITEENNYIFNKIPQNSKIGLYHSWIVDKHNLTKSLKITAICEDGNIMAIRHENYDLTGFQFHPESFVTEFGAQMIENWILR